MGSRVYPECSIRRVRNNVNPSGRVLGFPAAQRQAEVRVALDMSHEICAVFGWFNADQDRIKRAQAARFPAVD